MVVDINRAKIDLRLSPGYAGTGDRMREALDELEKLRSEHQKLTALLYEARFYFKYNPDPEAMQMKEKLEACAHIEAKR